MYRRCLAVLATCLVGALPLASSAATGKTVKIGTSVPLTGRLAAEGDLYKKGYELWAETVNAKGGIKVGNESYKVELLLYDDKSEPETATKLTDKLITQDKVDFLLATSSSGLVKSTATIAERYRKIMIAPIANAETLYKNNPKYLFGQAPRASANMASYLDMIASKKLDVKSIVIVTADDLFPLATAKGIENAAKIKGVKIAGTVKYPKASTDMSAVVSQLKALGADAVLHTSDYAEAVALVRQMKEQKVTPKLFGFQDAPGMPDFVPNLGKDAEAICGTSWWWENAPFQDQLFGSAKQFADLYRKKFKTDLVPYRPAAAAAAAEILQLAIEKAQSLDTEKVREALLNNTFETMFMPTRFGTTPDGLSQINVAGSSLVLQVQNGKPVPVFQGNTSRAPLVFPFPAWDKR